MSPAPRARAGRARHRRPPAASRRRSARRRSCSVVSSRARRSRTLGVVRRALDSAASVAGSAALQIGDRGLDRVVLVDRAPSAPRRGAARAAARSGARDPAAAARPPRCRSRGPTATRRAARGRRCATGVVGLAHTRRSAAGTARAAARRASRPSIFSAPAICLLSWASVASSARFSWSRKNASSTCSMWRRLAWISRATCASSRRSCARRAISSSIGARRDPGAGLFCCAASRRASIASTCLRKLRRERREILDRRFGEQQCRSRIPSPAARGPARAAILSSRLASALTSFDSDGSPIAAVLSRNADSVCFSLGRRFRRARRSA